MHHQQGRLSGSRRVISPENHASMIYEHTFVYNPYSHFSGKIGT